MPDPLVVFSADSGVVRLTLNRPQKRNALTRELLAELRTRLDEAARVPDLRCLILEGSGPVFCAGMDLAQMQETALRPDASALWQADTQLYHDVVAGLLTFRAPTVAVVQGPALAGGVGLVLACDLVLSVDTATFSLPEPKRGITAAIVTPLLVHRVGVSAASWLLLSGEGFNSQRAREAGLCHEVVATADLKAACDRRLASILSGAPGALAISKAQLLASSADVLKYLAQAVAVSAQARETPEAREGLAAFLEKREPRWQAQSEPS